MPKELKIESESIIFNKAILMVVGFYYSLVEFGGPTKAFGHTMSYPKHYIESL